MSLLETAKERVGDADYLIEQLKKNLGLDKPCQ